MFDFEVMDSTNNPNPISVGFESSSFHPQSSILQSSLNLDLIPTPRTDDFFGEDEEDEAAQEGGNPFSASAAQYIEDHREEEEEILNSLKDGMNVPAVVCENREKLAQLWQTNMRQWREGSFSLREKEKEVRNQKKENDRLRKEIEKAQKKLTQLQEATEWHCRVGMRGEW